MNFITTSKKLFQLLLVLLFPLSLAAQTTSTFSGFVIDEAGEAMIGATLNWKDTTIAAVTDIDGSFTIERLDTINPYLLVINYVGYVTVEVEILPSENNLKLKIEDNATLESVLIETRQRANFTSTLNPINVETIGQGELRRAACCNLSESFENNATVNVSFADAVTGAKEIEMLGLRGTYTQMLIENRPSFNRLGRAYGLEYIPGTFIESIQISKGASSVKNGVQGITGQINTELIKPDNAPLFFLNLFANHTGRIELNTQFNYRISQNWSTGLLIHGNYYGTEIDYNKDSFLDIPKKKQANVISRWLYKANNLHFEINLQGIWDSRSGGQTLTAFKNAFDSLTTQLYQVNSEVRRFGVFGKLGYFGFKNPSQSMAVIYDANIHQHQSIFGDKTYNALQKQIYANIVFQTDLVNPLHNLSTGLTYDLVDFKEQFTDINNDRTEHLAAVYAEYSFNQTINEKLGSSFGLILSFRTDLIHTEKFTKIYPSPRINIKYNFTENLVLRASGGRGVRTANLLVENLKYMPNSKNFSILEDIMPEVAWNYGLNLTWNFKINSKLGGNLSLDAYRTDFENQLIVDLDSDPTHKTIQFYNLQGQSFANSFLLTYTQDIVKGLEARIGYKFNDVRTTYDGSLHQMPFMPMHRGLVHLNYTTPKKDWEFNITLNIMGPQRLPHIEQVPGVEIPNYRYRGESPVVFGLNAHIAKFFKGGWEVYIGGENLTNYTQSQPILGYQDPFGATNNYSKFDASSIYASVFGVQVYAGVKYTFQGKDRFPPSVCGLHEAVVETQKPFEMSDEHQEITIKSSNQCNMCTVNIQEALYKIKGVKNVAVDENTQTIKVHYIEAKTSPEKIRQTISSIGYDADSIKADKTAYSKLHGCCKKPEDQ